MLGIFIFSSMYGSFSGPFFLFAFFVLLGLCGLQLAHDSKYCVMFSVVVSHGFGGVREFRRETDFSAF